MPKIKNIIIFTAIAVIFILIYVFFIKPSPEEANLVLSPSSATLPDINSPSTNINPQTTPLFAKDFLSLLLNVKNIKLDDSILSDPAFVNLRDSSIVLEPDGNEGRPNPFAPFGDDVDITQMTTQTTTQTVPDTLIPAEVPADTTTPTPAVP